MKKIKKLFNIFWVQLYLELKLQMRYVNSAISSLVLYAGAFLIVILFTKPAELGQAYGTKQGVLFTIVGFLFWSIGIASLGGCSNGVETDERTGLLESETQSVFPLWVLYFIQTLAENLFVWIYLLIIGIVASFFSMFTVAELLKAILLTFAFSLISNLGMFGIGMIFASGSIKFKRMGQWATILQALLLMLSNVYLPVYNAFQEIIPYVGGIEIVRQIFLGHGVSLSKLMLLIVVNVIWFLFGILIFNYCIKKERKNGSFDAF